MDERVPGISVPAATIERIARSSDPGEETYQLALEQARHALAIDGVAGLHLTSFRRDNAIARLCDDLGLGAGNARRRGSRRRRPREPDVAARAPPERTAR